MNTIHIAALFQTTAVANAARDSLVAAGVEADRILVLDRGHADADAPARSPRSLWSALKQVFLPDEDAHHYAEAIVRGYPLLVADITEAQREIAMAVLESASPVNIEAHEEGWVSSGWAAQDAGDQTLAGTRPGREAAGSEGITAGGLMAGDYGTVGAVQGASVNTDILRGRRMASPITDRVRVFQ